MFLVIFVKTNIHILKALKARHAITIAQEEIPLVTPANEGDSAFILYKNTLTIYIQLLSFSIMFVRFICNCVQL